MNKQKELAKNTAIITIGKICTQFISFLLMPLYTAILTASEYGMVDLLATYTSLFAPIVLLQADQALFRFLIDIRDDKKKIETIITTTSIFMFIQLLSALAIFFVIQFFFDFQFKWYLLFSIFITVIFNMMLQLSRGLGDNITYTVGSFLSAFLQIISNILFLTVFKLGITGMLLATILSQIIATLFIFIKKKIYYYIIPSKFSKDSLKTILRYSIPLIPNSLCWWALNASDRTIVIFFMGTAANGLLSVGHKFSSIYITIYNIFNLSWTESAALHIQDKDRDQFFSSVIVNMFKLFMFIGIVIIAIMPFAFKFLINEQYWDAYGVIPVFVLASMFNVVIGLYSVIYVALKKTNEIAKTSFYAGVINIIVHLKLIKVIGLYAAPVSSVLAFMTMAAYRYFDIKKYINVQLKFSTILITITIFIIGMIIYYLENIILQFIWLIIVIVMSIIMNINIIKPIYHIIIKKAR